MSVLKDVHDLLQAISLSWGWFGNEGKKASQQEVEMKFGEVTMTFINESGIRESIRDPDFKLDPATAELTPQAEKLFGELKEWLKKIDPDFSAPAN